MRGTPIKANKAVWDTKRRRGDETTGGGRRRSEAAAHLNRVASLVRNLDLSRSLSIFNDILIH